MELPPDDAATGTGSGSGSGVGGDAAPGTDAGVAYCNPSEPGLFGCYEFEGNAHNALPEITRLGAGAVATGVTPGIYIGGAAPDNPTDLYVGQLDQLRLFSVARAAQLICTDAGRAHCP